MSSIELLAAGSKTVYTAGMTGLPDKLDSASEMERELPSVTAESEATVQEGIDLLAQIEKAAAEARTPITAETFIYTPRRSGLFFPIALNIAALAVVALVAVLFPLYFGRQEQALAAGTGTTLTGARTLVSAIRREAEEKLRSKDQEIVQIQGSLDESRTRLAALRADADSQIQKKEQELRASFDKELTAEKARLRDQGTSAASIDSQLAVLRVQLQKTYDSKLAEFRSRLSADTAQKEAALLAQVSGSQATLTQAHSERAQLQAQLEAMTRTAASATGEQKQLAAQLASLEASDQREHLVLDQITASYAAAGAAMNASRLDDALGLLGSLAVYLDQASVASLPAVQQRKTVDLFLIDSLEKLVISRRAASQSASGGGASASVAPSSPPALSPRQTQALADAIAAGDALFEAGSFAAAVEKYGAGLSLLSDVSGMERLSARLAEAGFRQGLAELTARQDKAARPTVDKADAMAKRASYAEAIAAYAAVIRTWPSSSFVNRSLSGIDKSLTALLKKQDQPRTTTIADRLAVVTAGLGSTARAADVAVAAAQKELIALLDAKAKAKAVLGTEAEIGRAHV
jgi:hypothetical protein